MQIQHRLLILLASAAPLAAQQRQLTADDYARAERFLPAGTAPLVRGVPGTPSWLPGDRFWYRVDGNVFVVDPVKKTKTSPMAADTAGTSGPTRGRRGTFT